VSKNWTNSNWSLFLKASKYFTNKICAGLNGKRPEELLMNSFFAISKTFILICFICDGNWDVRSTFNMTAKKSLHIKLKFCGKIDTCTSSSASGYFKRISFKFNILKRAHEFLTNIYLKNYGAPVWMKQLFKLSSLQFVLLVQSIESYVYVRRSQAFPSKSLKIDFSHLTSDWKNVNSSP